MLTSDQISQLNNEWSSKNPIPVSQTVTKGMTNADYLAQHGGNIANPQTQEPQRNVLQRGAGLLLDPVAKLSSEAGQSMDIAGTKLAELFMNPQQKSQQEQKLSTMSNTSQTVPVLGTQVPALSKITPEQIGGQVAGTVGLLSGNPMVGGAMLGGGAAMERNAGTLDVVGNTVAGAVAGKILEVGVKAASPYISAAIEKYGSPMLDKLSKFIPDTAKETYQSIAEKVSQGPIGQATKSLNEIGTNLDKSISGKVSDITEGVVNKGKNLIGMSTKTEEQILATPEKDLGKLNTPERKVWFDNAQKQASFDATKQNEELAARHQELNAQHEQNVSDRSAQTTETAKKLQSQLETSSTGRAIELKPKVTASLKENSDMYKQLFENDMSGHENTEISNKSISDKINELYPDTATVDNSNKRAQIKNLFGTYETSEGSKSAGDVYNQIREMKSGLSSSAKKGAKVFTASDMQTNDAMNVLSSVLKDNGVDLSKSNAFWKQYAPIRNKMVDIVKPFDLQNIDTKKASKLIQEVAKGTSSDNKILVKRIEDLIGEPLADEQKAIVEKMSANEKVKFQNELKAKVEKASLEQQKLEEKDSNAIEQGITKESIKSKQAKLDNAARLKKWIIGTVTSFLVGGEIYKHLP